MSYGLEPKTIYDNASLRDLRGVDEVTNQIVEVRASNIRGKTLSPALEFAKQEVERTRQQSAQDIEDSTAAPVTNISPAQNDELNQASIAAPRLEEYSPARSTHKLIVKLKFTKRAAKALITSTSPLNIVRCIFPGHIWKRPFLCKTVFKP